MPPEALALNWNRGIVLRIVLDPSQQHAFDRLREIEGFVRTAPLGPYMHLKSYAIDGRLLRSGSAAHEAGVEHVAVPMGV